MREMRDEILNNVMKFAAQAHGDQERKYSRERYINHPIRVMKTCMEYQDELPVLAAALLHDVLEDTAVTEEELLHFLRSVMEQSLALNTQNLVVELTDIFTKENYPKLNRRQRKEFEIQRLAQVSSAAQTIKYADLIDNSENIAEHDPDFSVVFLNEGKKLLEMMNRGNPDLHAKALRVITKKISRLSGPSE